MGEEYWRWYSLNLESNSRSTTFLLGSRATFLTSLSLGFLVCVNQNNIVPVSEDGCDDCESARKKLSL